MASGHKSYEILIGDAVNSPVTKPENGKDYYRIFTATLFTILAFSTLIFFLGFASSSSFHRHRSIDMSNQKTIGYEGGIFTIFSTDCDKGAALDNEFVCSDLRTDDDKAAGFNPSIAWSNAPSNTVELLLLMTTTYGNDQTKYDWIFYSIPSTYTEIPSDIANENGLCDASGDYGSCGGTWPDRPEYYYKVYEYHEFALMTVSTKDASGHNNSRL